MSTQTVPPAPLAAAQDDDDYDPFDAFNRAQGAGQVENPYAMFAELRSQAPIAPLDLRAMMSLAGIDAPADGADGANGADKAEGTDLPTVYTAVSYDAVSEVLRDAKRFSSSGYAQVMGPVMGHSILEMDPPEHGLHRGLIQQAFSRRNLERWEHELVRPVPSRCDRYFSTVRGITSKKSRLAARGFWNMKSDRLSSGA